LPLFQLRQLLLQQGRAQSFGDFFHQIIELALVLFSLVFDLLTPN
jgi:hypothetical protein